MQLYKSRGFGEYFQDTFAFLKQNGKHLFKHFFIINGIFLLILMVLGYFFSKFYTDVIFGGLLNGNSAGIDEYMNQNSGVFIVLILVFIIVGLLAAMISYSYVPIYLKLYSKHDGKNFTATDIINTYKANIGKIFIFLLCGILIVIPLMLGVGILLFILAITIIGIFAMPLVIGAVSLFYQGALMEYLDEKRGIWDSFGYSWRMMSSKFWAAIACVGIFYLISYVAQNVIALIPYIFGMVNLFTEIETNTVPEPMAIQKTMTVMMLAIFLLTFLVSSILNVVVQLNQGIVYYSLKEDNENINTKSDIDLIGSGE
ncbi:hypothetical protein ES692_01295 [Psychroserpens burtonensis]|uniref:Glycerophosphoryl diester phosphodiesterase membrane domain-containing protein n=1 Tax=Psychroserpens burtonensis TaxID=49278 RepID=A0A5C7BCC5_9FLAO|nr:hypothetical protein [Psychroserpens burtonensis]TXE19923.1 hypothetical protein ES692_01295 [Psychroserpens burtonensis]